MKSSMSSFSFPQSDHIWCMWQLFFCFFWSHLVHVTTVLLLLLHMGSSLYMIKCEKCAIFTKINYFMYKRSYCIKIENWKFLAVRFKHLFTKPQTYMYVSIDLLKPYWIENTISRVIMWTYFIWNIFFRYCKLVILFTQSVNILHTAEDIIKFTHICIKNIKNFNVNNKNQMSILVKTWHLTCVIIFPNPYPKNLMLISYTWKCIWTWFVHMCWENAKEY